MSHNQLTNNLNTKKPQLITPKHTQLRSKIDPNAIKIINTLHKANYTAYLVGGCIRDLLLQKTPKDFDIVTDAKPEEIKQLFNNCLLIGRRFRLAHLRFGRNIIEVATFRATTTVSNSDCQKQSELGMILRDNHYGSIEDDVLRRDFTINALYFDLQKEQIVDYVNGTEDIYNNTLRIIGDPNKRYNEDPVRLLRAIRFSCKLKLKLERNTSLPIKNYASLLKHIAPARLFEEFMKLFFFGIAEDTFNALQKHHLFAPLFPQTHALITQHPKKYFPLVKTALFNTDQRIQNNKHINPGFLLATFLWPAYQEGLKKLSARNKKRKDARLQVIEQVFKKQRQSMSIPKKFGAVIEQIWSLQPRLENPTQTYAQQAFQNPKFRAGYDFLLLRANSIEPKLKSIASWWTELQEVEYDRQDYLFSQLPHDKPLRYSS